MLNKYLLKGASLFALAVFFAAAAQAQVITGGYSPALVDDERVVAAAKFAVGERAKKNPEQKGLKLDSVEKAEMQVVAGINYRLCMTVGIDEESQQVQAVVYQNLKQKYSLTSWTPVESCGESEAGDGEDTADAEKKTYPACRGDQLALKEAEAEADMGGKRYGNFVFTNTSAKTCAVSGFPTFVLLNKSGKALAGVEVKYDNDFPGGETENAETAITLEPKKTAWFRIFYNNGMAMESKKPFPVSAKVRITAPNDKREFVLKSKIQACCGVQVSSIRGGLPQ